MYAYAPDTARQHNISTSGISSSLLRHMLCASTHSGPSMMHRSMFSAVRFGTLLNQSSEKLSRIVTVCPCRWYLICDSFCRYSLPETSVYLHLDNKLFKSCLSFGTVICNFSPVNKFRILWDSVLTFFSCGEPLYNCLCPFLKDIIPEIIKNWFVIDRFV